MSALTRIAECADAPRFRPAQEALARRRAIDDQELTALMRAAQRGDRSAYASLLREVMSLLQRLFRHRLRYLQPADREDVMQEVLLSLHRAKSTYDPAKAFVPWLMAIIRNRVVDRARRCARLSANEVLVGEFDAIGPVAGFAQRDGEYGDPEALRRAISALPVGQRKAIELLKLRELPVKDAASVTGMSAGALRVSVHRAISNLRDALSGDAAVGTAMPVAATMSAAR